MIDEGAADTGAGWKLVEYIMFNFYLIETDIQYVQ